MEVAPTNIMIDFNWVFTVGYLIVVLAQSARHRMIDTCQNALFVMRTAEL
jgi:hypothetical protein